MIGMVITQAHRKPILPVLIVGRPACAVAVAGAAIRGTVVFRVVTAAPRSFATPPAACASPSKVTMFHL